MTGEVKTTYKTEWIFMEQTGDDYIYEHSKEQRLLKKLYNIYTELKDFYNTVVTSELQGLFSVAYIERDQMLHRILKKQVLRDYLCLNAPRISL